MRNLIKILLIIFGILIITGATIIVISLKENKRVLGKSLIIGGVLTILVIALLFLLLTNFEYAFIKFHEIIFNNNLWLLNPATDKLIIMFPENFFYDVTQNIVVRSLITAIVTTAIGFVLLIRKRKV